MTINFKTNIDELTKDYRLYLLRSLINRQNIIIFSVFIISLLIKISSQTNSTTELFSASILIGVSGVLILEVFYFIKNFYSISKYAKGSKHETGYIKFNKTNIEFVKSKGSFVVFNNDIKKVVCYGDSIFIVAKKSKFLPSRISKKEIGEGGFNLILEHFKIKTT